MNICGKGAMEMIRSFFFKLLVSCFTLVIVFSSVYFMCGGKSAAADISLKIMADKNSENISDSVDLPETAETADLSVMRSKPAELTVNDLRSIYIGGKKYAFPCTLADLAADYDVMVISAEYDEECCIYSCYAYAYWHDLAILEIRFDSPEENSPFDECVVRSLGANMFSTHISGCTPQIVIAGMDIYDTDYEEMLYLTEIADMEYIPDKYIYFPINDRYSGYVAWNMEKPNGNKYILRKINYIPDYDTNEFKKISYKDLLIFDSEITLPEDYSPEKYPGIPSENYPEIIDHEEDISPDIRKYNMTVYELMNKAGVHSLEIYYDYSVIDNEDYWVICCNVKDKNTNVFGLLKEDQQLGEAAVFYSELSYKTEEEADG